MATYAIGHLRDVALGADIITYLEHIDATLAPYGGRFLVHGGTPRVVEGRWEGDLVIIEFPDRRRAEDWYASAAYRRILPLRTRNAVSDVIFIDGVTPGHRAPDVLAGGRDGEEAQSSKSPAVSFSLPLRSMAKSALPSPSMSPSTTVVLPMCW